MDIDQQKTRIDEIFKEYDWDLSDLQIQQFLNYYRILIDKNQVMNLTAITEFNEVCVKHFLDSSMLLKYAGKEIEDKIRKGDEPSLIDVGSGAGFPGIPLKIMCPELDITLMDALKKRTGFLNEIICELKLPRTEAVHARAEELAREKREYYDYAVSRAVAYLPILSEYCLPFVKTGGIFAAYKSGNYEEELKSSENAFKVLGAELEHIHSFTLPDGSERSLILLRKKTSTPEQYPRRSKKIETRPL